MLIHIQLKSENQNWGPRKCPLCPEKITLREISKMTLRYNKTIHSITHYICPQTTKKQNEDNKNTNTTTKHQKHPVETSKEHTMI